MKILNISLIFTFFVFIILVLTIDHSNLPDYEGYKLMFERVSNINSFNVYDGIVFVFDVFSNFFSSYQGVRILSILFFSSIFFINIYKLNNLNFNNSIKKSELLFIIPLISFALLIFLVEFFLIRLRAGFSISIFLFWVVSSRKKYLSYFFLLISLILHIDTAIILFFMFLPICTKGKLYENNFLKLFYLTLLVTIFYYLDSLILLFRPDWLSELNIVRAVFSFYIPTLLIIYYNYKNKSSKEIRTDYSTSTVHLLNFSICIAFLLNYITITGEVIVRIATLSSLLSIYLISKRISKKSFYYGIYMLVVNSMFFLNTIKSIF